MTKLENIKVTIRREKSAFLNCNSCQENLVFVITDDGRFLKCLKCKAEVSINSIKGQEVALINPLQNHWEEK